MTTTEQRQIKFRAWDGERMREAFGWYIDPTDGTVLRNDDFYQWRLMQFTGLCDSNGVEIYEGDILFWDGEIIGAVSFEYAEFIVGEGVSARNLCNAPTDDIRVVGNIYENHDLIPKGEQA